MVTRRRLRKDVMFITTSCMLITSFAGHSHGLHPCSLTKPTTRTCTAMPICMSMCMARRSRRRISARWHGSDTHRLIVHLLRERRASPRAAAHTRLMRMLLPMPVGTRDFIPCISSGSACNASPLAAVRSATQTPILLSARCTVYFEKMLKGSRKPSLWLRNIQLVRSFNACYFFFRPDQSSCLHSPQHVLDGRPSTAAPSPTRRFSLRMTRSEQRCTCTLAGMSAQKSRRMHAEYMAVADPPALSFGFVVTLTALLAGGMVARLHRRHVGRGRHECGWRCRAMSHLHSSHILRRYCRFPLKVF